MLQILIVLSSMASTYAAKTSIPAEGTARFVAENLDVTQIRSSLGPRRSLEKKHFADYGFKIVNASREEAHLEGGAWSFHLTVLERAENQATVCIEDKALNGGSYQSQAAYTVKLQNGLLVPSATKHVKCVEKPSP